MCITDDKEPSAKERRRVNSTIEDICRAQDGLPPIVVLPDSGPSRDDAEIDRLLAKEGLLGSDSAPQAGSEKVSKGDGATSTDTSFEDNKVSHAGTDYSFPVFKDEESRIAEMLKLKDEKESGNISGKAVDNYETYRPGICATQIERNHGGKVSPYFRKAPKARFHKDRTKPYPDVLLSNDQQVIDLHWLWLFHRDEVDTDDSRFESLFRNNECFDFDLASGLVRTVGPAWRKAEVLGIPKHIQIELASIQGSPTRELKKQVLKTERRKVVKRIRENSTKLNISGIQEWADFYVVFRLARGDSPHALRLYRVMKGGDPWKDDETAKRIMDKKRLKLERSYIQISRDDWKSEALFGSP